MHWQSTALRWCIHFQTLEAARALKKTFAYHKQERASMFYSGTMWKTVWHRHIQFNMLESRTRAQWGSTMRRKCWTWTTLQPLHFRRASIDSSIGAAWRRARECLPGGGLWKHAERFALVSFTNRLAKATRCCRLAESATSFFYPFITNKSFLDMSECSEIGMLHCLFVRQKMLAGMHAFKLGWW